MIAVSAMFFGDKMTHLGMLGMGISIAGICIYTYMKMAGIGGLQTPASAKPKTS
jgi:uncharacterized membrane protein YedE/YeeE